ncbi:peptidoglycan D,D-transpeptidase FtsI family protein [Bacillus marinisedimentorum]|uniref:peptidoglycan D,D-transpeptidase FtsI family protein n=1 Tax=Bacillus marinisedimentorum TaxID=1821260 RepID=UPI0007DF90A5|nr:penicillin-binding protein 2 [Bacillus marinisedimentorum]
MAINAQGKKMKKLPKRLNVLFFLVFAAFLMLIIRLGVIQIVYGEEYQKEMERTEKITVAEPAPRGKILDRSGNVVVDNKPLKAITYVRQQGVSQQDRLETAAKLAKYINVEPDSVTERDKKDYWILTRPEQAEQKVTAKERNGLNDDQIYKLTLDRISDEDLSKLTEQEQEIIAIKRTFDAGYPLTPQYVKNEGVTDQEYATVSSHLDELPGVQIATDWDRVYPYDETLETLIGNITNAEQGLPREELDSFLVKGYQRNDRVGISYLEKQYEGMLQGHKEKTRNVTNPAGEIVDTELIRSGKRGNDLVLATDMELQKKVEEIIESNLSEFKAKYPDENQLLDSAYVVMMDPNTGEVLSLAGKKMTRKDGRTVFQDYATGVVNNAYEVGSSIKGATVLTGYETGVIKPNSYLVDTPIKIKGTPIKKSYKTMGKINDITALQQSSNVFMFKIAMMMGGYDYQYGKSAPFKKPEAFDVMRNSFSRFGLGVKTGIDLPHESTGYRGSGSRIGNLMDLSIGQYDTYTTMQLAQYISTIANGGKRLKPILVNEIREPEKGASVYRASPHVLNTLEADLKQINRVKEGFRKVFQEKKGTAYQYFKDTDYRPAGKTGTAETTYYGSNKELFGTKTTNLSLVGFAPLEKPEVAFAVVVPYTTSQGHINGQIGREIMDAYFELKKQEDVSDSQ